MRVYARLIYPFLSLLDAEVAHNLTVGMLENVQDWGSGQSFLGRVAGDCPSSPVFVSGIKFPNRLGVAAGFDKDVRVAAGLAHLGFGHIEVGTLTPRPQEGNPKPRVFRYKQQGALINRMGFPNGGVRAALPRLRQLDALERDWVLGVSLGKQKETPLNNAVQDYIEVMQFVYPHSDYLAVNISSPNTPGLRELQTKQYISDLLGQLKDEGREQAQQADTAEKPFFVKIAPDIDEDGLNDVIGAALDVGVAGIIATNTTRGRESLPSEGQHQEGGMSGSPLHTKSIEVVKQVKALVGDQLGIIGVGGIRTAKDAQNMLDAGASVVQLYTGMVYEGPRIAGRILRELEG